MLTREQKLGVMKRLEWKVFQRADGSWAVRGSENGRRVSYTKLGDRGWDDQQGAENVAWAWIVKLNDLYLHKKGGIYCKEDERTIQAGEYGGEITVVNYHHVYPHAPATGCRLLEEWSDGRFVKLTPQS